MMQYIQYKYEKENGRERWVGVEEWERQREREAKRDG